jgi:ribonuclease R
MAVPMLPEKLSSDLCSLREGEDRCAFSCMINLDNAGKVLNYKFVKSVIHVEHGLTYEQSEELFAQKHEGISLLAHVAGILREQRQITGILELNAPERKVLFNDKNEPLEIVPRIPIPSNNWVEECMLIANQCCARELVRRKLAGIYRVHEAPDNDSMKDLLSLNPDLAKGSPVSLAEASEQSFGTNIQPLIFKLYQNMITQANKVDALIYQILRSMKKAGYSEEPSGHFALNWQDYAHFTSPIRRYADLWVHRELSRPVSEDGKPADADLSKICSLISENEITNMKIERASFKICAAWILKDYIGDEFEGEVSGLTEFGLFVSIPKYGAEGLIKYKDMPGGYYLYDPGTNTAYCKQTKMSFKNTDKLRVQLIRVNIIKGEVDLALLEKL